MPEVHPSPRPSTTTAGPSPRVVAAILLLLAVIFSFWCAVTLQEAHELRRDLDAHLDWLQDLRWARGEVPTWNAGSTSLDGSAWKRLGGFVETSGRIARSAGDPEMLVARQNLQAAYERLRKALEATPDANAGGAWEPAMAVLRAGDGFGEQVERRLETLHRRRDDVGRSTNVIGIAAVLLSLLCPLLYLLAERRRADLRTVLAEYERQTTHDRLTGLWNREGMLRLLGQELIRAERADAPLSLVLVDIERFAEINRLIGQDQGDDILRAVADRLGTLVRPYDTMGRFGGDSFLIALPGCDERSTQNVAQRLLQSVHDHKFQHSYGRIDVKVKAARLTVRRPADANVDALVIELQKQLET